MQFNLVTVIGILASVLTGICNIPQLIKIVKEKNATSISIKMIVILMIGLAFWVFYGLLLKNIKIIISNAFAALVNGLLLLFASIYKNQSKGRELGPNLKLLPPFKGLLDKWEKLATFVSSTIKYKPSLVG